MTLRLRENLIVLGILILILYGAYYLLPSPHVADPESLAHATSLFNTNDLARSLHAVNSALETDPRNTQLLLMKASILAQKGNLSRDADLLAPQAIESAQQVLSQDRNNVDAWRIVGYAHEIMEDFEKAHMAYDRALQSDPNDAETLAQKAHAYDLQGAVDAAEQYYTKALASDPRNEKAYLGLGRVAVFRGELEKALGHFSLVAANTKHIRTKAEATYSAGSIALELKRYNLALSFMRESTRADPYYDAAWLGLATALFQLSLHSPEDRDIAPEVRLAYGSESFDALEKALSLNPQLARALYQLGMQLITVGKKTEGIAALNAARDSVANDISLSVPQKQQTKALIEGALSVTETL